MRERKRILRPRLRLRGAKLVKATLRELADFAFWGDGPPLSWESLAERMGVSRQALASKPEVVAAFHRAKDEIRKGETEGPENIVRKTYTERIKDLEHEIAGLKRQIDSWIEKWVTVEFNCRVNGIDADKVFAPLSKPDRATR